MKKFNKEQYRNLKYNGFEWVGYWDNLHHFSKGNNIEGFKTISCNEEMLTNGDIEFMSLHELSFNPKRKNNL